MDRGYTIVSLAGGYIYFIFGYYTFLFRSRLSNYFKGKSSDSEDSLTSVKGQKAIVKKEITPGELGGKVEFNGTRWNAEAEEFIPEGTVVQIVERKNLVLKVKKIVITEIFRLLFFLFS